MIAHAHEHLWKGALTTVLGVVFTGYGLAGNTLFASSFFAGQAAVASPQPAEIVPMSMANVSTAVGFVTTIAGSLWTWFLLQQAKRQDVERDQRKKEEDARLHARVAQERAEIKLMLERGFAAIRLHQAEMAARSAPQEPKP